MSSRKWKPHAGPARRHYEDDVLRDEVRALLLRLPGDHPARVAFDDDAPTLEVQRLIDERDLVDAIGRAFNRWRDRAAAFRPQHFNPYDKS